MSGVKFDFYVQSWLTDKPLQKCSLDAQGLWINLICLMQKSPVRGKLMNKKGEVIPANEIHKIIDKPENIIEILLNELLENKVLKVDEAGAFYSKKLLEVNESKKKKEEPYYKEAMEYYFEWYEKKFSVKPRILIVDGKSLKLLLQHFTTLETEKYNRFQLFKIMLDNWHKLDTYLQKGTDLRLINSNINRILTELGKTNKNKSNTKMEAIVDANEKIKGFDYNTLKKQQ